MANALPPMFHGDGRTGENPQNFIRQLRSAMRTFTDIATDTQKIEMFADNLSAGSEADDWFLELPDSEKATWPTLQTAFSTRWPAMPPAKKSRMEIQRELYGKRIDLDKLGSKVKSATRRSGTTSHGQRECCA
ncbi:hypothetical protein EW146_g7016 [Bondarzewia mesenterica]|uniref:Retrotransposon gag domain-containing protein n=1 Tax=Bondarzewia mesenterica TaxID=1095465 RepID=A0A4S4LNW2_9AGAM|nr:hypothetical protein EW146_g7016 [Bondarzewia mesenterica]